jgi:3-deoxy-D-manno-octulosonate 8-phosphate phosphatase (KDO 8-P phosphatase)
MGRNTGSEHLGVTTRARRPQPIAEIDWDRLRAIRILILDCDGVMTDGRVWVSPDGTEQKAFSVVDGHGIAMLRESGVLVGMMTRSPAGIPNARAKKLCFDIVHTGVMDKAAGIVDALDAVGIDGSLAAYMGDDLPDIGAMRQVGVSITVPTGRPEVLNTADAVTTAQAGAGAVREVCDAIIRARRHRP